MNKYILLLGLLSFAFFTSNAQKIKRTEEYAFLEQSTHCSKGSLSVTNNAGGTTLREVYDRDESSLTDAERLLIAMNDLNAKGFKLKSTTVVSKKCRSKRAFLFFKSRPLGESLTASK